MLKGIKIYKSDKFFDNRGSLWTSWKKNKKYKVVFNHDKFSVSKKMSLEDCITIIKHGNL